MFRISADLLNKINMNDPEAAYIIHALDYVYSSDYRGSPRDIDYLNSMESIAEELRSKFIKVKSQSN